MQKNYLQNGCNYYLEGGPFFSSLEELIDYYMMHADGIPVTLRHPIKSLIENDMDFVDTSTASLALQDKIKVSVGTDLQISESDIELYFELGSGNFGKVNAR